MNLKQKTLRELKRPFKQLKDRIALAQAISRRKRYDNSQRQKVVRTPGSVRRSKNVAVVLVYQPDGILRSLFHMLEHLVEKGISPVVVANHPLSEEQLGELKELSHLVMTRPNVGYDFGGYREGVLTVLETGPAPENLFLINDSIWFPVRDNCTLLEEAIDAPEDIFGLFYNNSYNNRRLHHLPSFFYRFNGHSVNSLAFRKYWKSIPFFNDKSLVINFCEMRTTSYFSRRGFSIGFSIGAHAVSRAASSLNIDQKVRVSRYFASTKSAGNKIFGDYTEKSPDLELDRKLQDLMCNSRFPFYFIDNHPFIFIEKLASPVIKKNREFRFWTQRKEMKRFGLDQELSEPIKSELMSWDLDKRLVEPPHEARFVDLQQKWEI